MKYKAKKLECILNNVIDVNDEEHLVVKNNAQIFHLIIDISNELCSYRLLLADDTGLITMLNMAEVYQHHLFECIIKILF